MSNFKYWVILLFTIGCLLIGIAISPENSVSSFAQSLNMTECNQDNDCINIAFNYAVGDEATHSILLTPDPDLEPGFPVKTLHTGGTYHAGAAIHTLIGNLDEDEELEIVVTGLATGPLYAWNYDGMLVAGWPITLLPGAGYPAMGNLSNNYPGLEIFTGHWGIQGRGKMGAYSGSGVALPGWPQESSNFVTDPPSLIDVTGDFLDDIFIGEQSFQLYGYGPDGSALPGWPVFVAGGQDRQSFAIADLDNNGGWEIIMTSGKISSGVYLDAYHQDGTEVDGFPITFDGPTDSYPTVGDVDNDGSNEIIVATKTSLLVYSASGLLENTIPTTGSSSYGSAPALADLDGDEVPEMVRQSNTAISIKKGDGSDYPGWPVIFCDSFCQGNSAPVVGDVDGDQSPDILIVRQFSGSSEFGQVLLYHSNGVLHTNFPKDINIGAGAVPAIADIDLDGRNEIIITGSYWNGFTGYYDKVWVYDLGGENHGKIEWGQFCGNAQHFCRYPVSLPTINPTNTPTPTPTLTHTITPTSTPTFTPSVTSTPSITPTLTFTPTPTNTLSPTITSTLKPTNTPTASATPPYTWAYQLYLPVVQVKPTYP